MNHLEKARMLRSIIEGAVQSLPDSEALEAITLHPEWASGQECPAGYKVKRNGRLWRCIQSHTSQEGWEPENAHSLWEGIDETHSGTIADPIPYEGNMALTAGLYYSQGGRVYLCNRDTVSPVYNPLSALVGIYVELA